MGTVTKATLNPSISFLTNALYYWLDTVLIIQESDTRYRLIVQHKKRILVDETYEDAKGAKIAFLKIYEYRLTETIESILKNMGQPKAKWTPFYTPSAKWLAKLNIPKEPRAPKKGKSK